MIHERILTMGVGGTGKTDQLLKIARLVKRSGAQVWVVDTDDAYELMLKQYPGLSAVDGGNVHVFPAFEWREQQDALQEIKKQAVPHKDWVGVDRISAIWGAVQRWYAREKYNETLGERMLRASKQMKKAAMLIPQFEQSAWLVINEQYEDFINDVLYRLRCHVYLTASVRSIRSDADNKAARAEFAAFGVRPEGQKDLQYQPHSMFLFSKDGPDAWTFSTVKDRGGRKYAESEPLKDFAVQYLVQRAGWRP